MIQNTLWKLQKQEMFRIRKGRSNDYDSFHFEAKHEGSIGWSKGEGEIVVYREKKSEAAD